MTSMVAATACLSVQGVVDEKNPWVGWVCDEAHCLQLERSAPCTDPSQEPRAVGTVTWAPFTEFLGAEWGSGLRLGSWCTFCVSISEDVLSVRLY